MKDEYFYRSKKRVEYDKVAFNEEEFVSYLKTKKPKELWCNEWSSKKPFLLCSNYTDNGLTIICPAWADKTPRHLTYGEFYEKEKIYISNFSVKIPDEDDGWMERRESMYNAWKEKENTKSIA